VSKSHEQLSQALEAPFHGDINHNSNTNPQPGIALESRFSVRLQLMVYTAPTARTQTKKFKSRQQSRSQPMTEFEFTNQSGRQDLNLRPLAPQASQPNEPIRQTCHKYRENAVFYTPHDAPAFYLFICGFTT
jgi:hypothetical protein